MQPVRTALVLAVLALCAALAHGAVIGSLLCLLHSRAARIPAGCADAADAVGRAPHAAGQALGFGGQVTDLSAALDRARAAGALATTGH